jgi:hypothetical protein
MMLHMTAIPVQRIKRQYASGIVEINIWRVPAPIAPCLHQYKYRLVYVVNGIRLVGYDNERGKGDHRHLGTVESPYEFVNVATLLKDFWQDAEEGVQE